MDIANALYPVLKDHADAVLEELSIYGADFAANIFKNQQYRLFDPMVSDWSCQIRSIWLFWFLKTHTFSSLSCDDILFFALVRLLCDSSICITHDITGKIPVKTKSSFWPDSMHPLPRIGKEILYGQAKQIVACRTLKDLQRVFSNIPENDLILGTLFDVKKHLIFDELQKAFARPYLTSYSEVKIPMLPFFFGVLIVISIAAYLDIPLCSIVRFINSSDATRQAVHHRVDFFRYRNFQVSDVCEAVLAISAYSTYQMDGCIQDCLQQITHLSANYIDFFYCVAATHELVPQRYAYDLSWCPYTAGLWERFSRQGRNLHVCSGDIVRRLCQNSSLTEITPTIFDVTHVYPAFTKDVL